MNARQKIVNAEAAEHDYSRTRWMVEFRSRQWFGSSLATMIKRRIAAAHNEERQLTLEVY